MAIRCDCGGDIRKTIDDTDECLICGTTVIITIKGDDKMAKEHDFKIEKISGTATVIDIGKTFTTYRKFAKASGYEEAVGQYAELNEGAKVCLLAKGEHEYSNYGTIYVIETDEGDKHLIGHDGLKIDEPSQMPEQTYVEIAEPFGKQFRDAIREAYSRGFSDGSMQVNFDAEVTQGQRTTKAEETPQEKRDRIVEQAKADIEGLKNRKGHYEVDNSISRWLNFCNVEFVVNKEKRAVVAILKDIYSEIIRAKGIAKCMPDDCFNVHIGKAIALRKALGENIAVYMDVPNPTEVRVGDVVRTTSVGYPIWGNGRVTKIEKPSSARGYYVEDSSYNYLKDALIIDDSREATE